MAEVGPLGVLGPAAPETWSPGTGARRWRVEAAKPGLFKHLTYVITMSLQPARTGAGWASLDRLTLPTLSSIMRAS